MLSNYGKRNKLQKDFDNNVNFFFHTNLLLNLFLKLELKKVIL